MDSYWGVQALGTGGADDHLTSGVGGPGAAAAAAWGPPSVYMPPPGTLIFPDVPKCHLHTKPVLSCKFCRKYKMAVHHQARLAQIQQITGMSLKRDCLEMINTTTYNLNPMLRENIMASEYFKSLYSYSSVHEIIDEIQQYVDHAEPYCGGNIRAPSTLFCCLYKLFIMKLTEDELLCLLEDSNIWVRATGYLWLRYVHPPDKLWAWFENQFLDDEKFIPSTEKAPQNEITFGEYLEGVLTDDRYFTTVFPRLPAKVKNNYGIQLVTLSEHRRRKRRNKWKIWKFKPGVDVMACYKCEWRYGTFTELYEDEVTGQPSALIKFDDIDITDAVPVDLGLVIILSKKHKRQRMEESVDAAKRSDSEEEEQGAVSDHEAITSAPGVEREELLQEFKRRERDRALAVGKDYAKRPSSFKAALSSKLGHGAKAAVAGKARPTELVVTDAVAPLDRDQDRQHRDGGGQAQPSAELQRLQAKYHSDAIQKS